MTTDPTLWTGRWGDLHNTMFRSDVHPDTPVRVVAADPAPTDCPHNRREWTIGGPEDSDGYVVCLDCRRALHPEDDPAPTDPHYPEHQWVWVDGNNIDAVVIYREWQRYQRASAERWENESNRAADPAPTGDQPSPWTPEREAAGAALDYAEGRISYDAFEKAVARYSNSLDAVDPAPTGDQP